MGPERSIAFRRGRRSASVTLVALCMTTALGLGLGSYLSLCSRSAHFSARNANLEKARQLADAGLEEALWALNYNTWTSSGPGNNATWTTTGADRTISLDYTLPGTALTGTVNITIANFASTGPTWPTITSNATISGDGGPAFTKAVRATTTPLPIFGNAIASSDWYVSFVAGGTVDSWNSDPDNNSATAAVAYSFTAGNPNNYAAVVAGRGDGTFGVKLTQATVRGYVTSFGLPISYSTSGSPAASVVGPSTTSGTTIDPARLGRSAFVPSTEEFKVTMPSISGSNFSLLDSVLNLVSGALNIPSQVNVCKKTGNLTIDGNLLNLVDPASVIIDKPVQIIVDGNFTITNGGELTITTTGSLELFVTGDVSIGGNGVRNLTKDPKKFVLYCTSASTSDALTYTSSADFCGVIYCENKPIEIQQNATFYGALLSRQHIRFTNSATAPVFHYDLALRQTRFSSVSTPYAIKRIADL